MKIIEQPDDGGIFLTDEDREKIMALTLSHVELPSIARALNIDPERFIAEYQDQESSVREVIDQALAKMEID